MKIVATISAKPQMVAMEGLKNTTDTCSVTPNSSAPTSAPTGWPRPPRTMTMKPISV
ncbi:hypothetical protein D3C78_1585450 [compost metagenome]